MTHDEIVTLCLCVVILAEFLMLILLWNKVKEKQHTIDVLTTGKKNLPEPVMTLTSNSQLLERQEETYKRIREITTIATWEDRDYTPEETCEIARLRKELTNICKEIEKRRDENEK